MDERELTNYLLAIVDQTAYRLAARRILGVHLAIGGRRKFDYQALQITFHDAARGTVAEDAQLFVNVLPVRHHCQNCGHDFDATCSECACPECGHPHTKMIGGEEVRLLDLDLDDTAA